MLSPYISELLYTNNCVVVPGFGGFVANNGSAVFHAKSQMLYPPHKRIAFNINLRGNDGLLANHIALLKGISYNEALQFIEDTVVSWTNQLGNTRQLVLHKLGSIENNGGSWIFTSNTSVNYHAQAYGLSPIHVQPINIAKQRTKVEPTRENRAPIQHPEKPNREKLYRNIAIAMPVACLLILAVLNPSSIGHLYTAGIGFFSPKVPDVVPVSMPVVKKSSIDTAVVDAVSQYHERRYYLVAGCFQDYNNAKGLVISLRKKGYPSTLAGTRKGMTVVSYVSFANKREALTEFHKIQSTNPYVWVMRK